MQFLAQYADWVYLVAAILFIPSHTWAQSISLNLGAGTPDDGAGGGSVAGRVVQMVDPYPTLVELCGLPQPAGLEGHSLVPLLKEPNAPWDHPAYTVWSEGGTHFTGVMVRTERWRYAEYYGRGAGAMLLEPAPAAPSGV